MVQCCFVPDCSHKQGDQCRLVRFPKTPMRKVKWIEAIRRADVIPHARSVVCTCHFPDGIVGLNLKKTPKIFRRNPEHRHLFKGSKRKKLLEHLPTLHENVDESDPSICQSSGILSASANSTFGVGDWDQSFDLGVSYLDGNQVGAVGQVGPLSSSTPHVPMLQKRQQLDEGEHLLDEELRDPEALRTPTRKKRRLTAASPVTPGRWEVSELETPECSAPEAKAQAMRLKLVTPRVRQAATQVTRYTWKELGLVRDSNTQTENAALTKDAYCQTSVIMFDENAAYQAFGSNSDVLLYLLKDNNDLKEKLYRMETAKKESDAQCQSLQLQVATLQNELDKCKEKLTDVTTKFCTEARRALELQEQLSVAQSRVLYRTISTTNTRVKHFTGIPNAEIFDMLCNMIPSPLNYYRGWKVDKLSREDQLFMTLMKLRLNFDFLDLATWFDVSPDTVSNVVFTWLDALHTVVYAGPLKEVPKLSKIRKSLPSCFKGFDSCRMIIDCTEVETANPKTLGLNRLLWSNYKKRTTLKGLVGIAPNGTVVFVSSLFPGSTSDKAIVQKSKLLDVFEPGDTILADKGFLIKDCLPKGVHINIPPILNVPQFTATQVERTRSIARARIHVERAIRRIKEYLILDYIPPYLRAHSSKIWQVCAALTNLQYPLIKEVEAEMNSINVQLEDIDDEFDEFTWK